jgi:serine-type D-Ala-D-Ala carboxypeptidase/endopeptidase
MRALVVAVVTALALLPGSVGPANAAPPTLNPGSEPGSAREHDLVTTAAEEILASTAKGVAIAIVKPGMGPDFAVTTTYYFGAADVAANRLVGPTTQFEIASETKTYTGALLAQALAAGLVQLDDPVSKWVPAPHTVPSLDGAVITLRDLATHRSGLADDPPNLGNKADYTVEKLWEGLDNAQLLSKPGSTWLYSDWGFGLLGTVLANLFMPNQPQPPFGPVVTENLTAPLGLDSTLLEIPTPDRAVGYNENGPAPYWNNTAALAGGGGLLSNATDMADWCRATLGIGLDPLAFLLPTELLPLAKGEDNKDGMGMAWQLYPNAIDFPVPYAYKNGGSSGFSSATFLVPSTKWAITVLSNGHDDQAVSTAARKVMVELARESALPGTGSSFGS